MPNKMIKCGSIDNAMTYQHICDETSDMANINPAEITLGSSCIVLEGEGGGLELYLANSKKQWILVTGAFADEEE